MMSEEVQKQTGEAAESGARKRAFGRTEVYRVADPSKAPGFREGTRTADMRQAILDNPEHVTSAHLAEVSGAPRSHASDYIWRCVQRGWLAHAPREDGRNTELSKLRLSTGMEKEMDVAERDPWFADDTEDDTGIHIDQYDITASPNDFNLVTIGNFIDRGAVRIPGFQRHFVWDLPRASRLIESLILGLPVPQLFLYEESRNRFLVIDGQQRLMSIYYFIKQRFPRQEQRQKLRSVFDDSGRIPDEMLNDDNYFKPFRLHLSGPFADGSSRFHGLDYDSLGEYQSQFDLRPLRNIVVKQASPSEDDSSIFEIFNRLNTGGMNLRPQEIRTSMYHSGFYTMLYGMNTDARWRSLLGAPEPDLHLKDVEVLLRGFALLVDGDVYTPSMLRFLNRFSKKCRRDDGGRDEYLKELFRSFLEACRDLPGDAFRNPHDSRFNIMLYEAVFTAACGEAFAERRKVTGALSADRVRELKKDGAFTSATASNTTSTTNVKTRLRRSREIVGAL